MTNRQVINIIPVQATQTILETKRNEREEFFVNLFEYCNLSCSFCWQDHDSVVGMDTIEQRADDIIYRIEQRGITACDINMMGGELFCDEIDDSLFDQYLQFSVKIHNYAHPKNISVHFCWVTNLVYHNVDRVLTFLQNLRQHDISTSLTTSYDPTGRFNQSTLRLWLDNLKIVGDEITNISVVLTKPNIASILKDSDSTWKLLYEKYTLFVDYYSPEKNAKAMAPSDDELLAVFYHLIDRYPQVGPIRDWMQRHSNKMTCRSSNVILPTGENGMCRKLVDKNHQHLFESNIDTNDNGNMEHTFISKHDCITCEYFQRCGLGCFLLSDFMQRSRLDECVFKLTYDYITKGIRHDER